MKSLPLIACFVTLGTLSGVGATLRANVYHLRDGTRVAGAFIGEADATVTVLLESGAKRTLPRADILCVEPSRSTAKLERRARRERARFLKSRQREARADLLRFVQAQRTEQPEPGTLLGHYTGRELAPGLSDLVASRDETYRETALACLRKVNDRSAVVPLVRGALHGPPDFSERSHEASLQIDSNLTRRVYEYVAAGSKHIEERLRAFDYIQSIGDARSIPAVLEILGYVDAVLRVQLVRTKGIREVPVSLGSQRAAASRVQIDLPELELIEVAVSTQVPVRTLTRVRNASVATLQKISNRNYGEDVEAWKRWWAAGQNR